MSRLPPMLWALPFAVACLLLACPVSPTHSATIHVPGDFPTVQEGLDAAAGGDTVQVACGSYPESLVMRSGVTLRGETPGCVILQGNGMWRLMEIVNAGTATRIENLVFINGLHEVGASGRGQGGAVRCEASSPVFADCSFQSCRAGYFREPSNQAAGDGGAIYCVDSSPAFEDCDFQINWALSTTLGDVGRGGAVFASGSSVALLRCQVIDNRAGGQGGGICGETSILTFRDCHFNANESLTLDETGAGGAIYESGGAVEIIDCLIRWNLADCGGAVHTSHARMTGCTITENWAARGGSCTVTSGAIRHSTFRRNRCEGLDSQGGALVAGPGTVVESCRLTENLALANGGAAVGGIWIDCVIDGNLADLSLASGGGLYLPESVTGCTIVGNTAALGSGIDGAVPIRNSVIAFNHGGEGVRGEATLTCCNLIGNEGGDWVGPIADQLGTRGNLTALPLFCDPAHGDYTVAADSPLLPSNNSCGVQIGALGQGCGPISLEGQTWARVKARYR